MTDQKELISAADFIETHKEPTRWLLEGLLPEVGVAAISGGSNSGKSWVGLELAIDLASGAPFLRQPFNERGPVLILCAGENLQAMAERMMALCRGKGVEVPKEIYFDQSAMDFSDNLSVKAFRGMVKRTGCRMVVIDNFRQYLPKMAEHSGYWVGKCLQNLREVSEGQGICSLILQQNEGSFEPKEIRYRRPGRGLSVLIGQSDVLMDLSAEDGKRTLAVVKNRLGEKQIRLRFGIFSEVDESGEELSHLILLEEPGVVTRQTRIAEHTKDQLRRILIAHKGEAFSRKALMEALGAAMPLPRQRNLDEAFAELGKDLYVKVFYEGREKVYAWQDDFIANEEKLEAEWALDPDADVITQANQLEEMGLEAMKMAKRAMAK